MLSTGTAGFGRPLGKFEGEKTEANNFQQKRKEEENWNRGQLFQKRKSLRRKGVTWQSAGA